MKEPLPQLLITCDFDGTVTRQDTLVEILNAFGAPTWHRVQSQVVSGELSIREGLEKEMGGVRATPEELKLVLSGIEVEPSFPPFVKAMRARGVPLVLLSGGFDLCVETVLARAHLWPLPTLANRLHKSNGAWHVEFPFPSLQCSACGHCKADPIRMWNDQGYTTVFVGNGVTDRCAAQAAQITFANDELSRWCRAHGIEALAFQDFHDIEQELMRRGWL